MCLKFSNAGNRLCEDDGYQINQGYFVYLSYEGETAAEVWESGPWNVDDNYWATRRDPQPRTHVRRPARWHARSPGGFLRRL